MLYAISQIAESLQIDSSGFTFAGRRFDIPGEPGVEETRSAIVNALVEQIYLYCFCRPFEGSLIEAVPMDDVSDDLSTELSAANQAKPRWSEGWTINSIEALTGRITAKRGDEIRWFWPGEFFVPDLSASPPRAGAKANVHVGTESFRAQPGFYFGFGESLEDRRENLDIVRFYWSVSSKVIGPVVKKLTHELNRFFVPYRFKCLIKSSLYWRLDSLVLYVERRFYQITATLISPIYEQMRGEMKQNSPLFTKPLAPGLGLAEDPGSETSFGLHRSRILARLLLEAQEHKAASEELLQVVERGFEQEGIALAKPYLNPGSIDDYEFAVRPMDV